MIRRIRPGISRFPGAQSRTIARSFHSRPGMTPRHTCTASPFPRQDFCPSFCADGPHQIEGAGNAGCSSHPQPRTQEKSVRVSHHRYAEHSGIPCAMALRLIPCSLRRSGFFVTVACETSRKLRASVEALRPHGFVVRAGALVSCTTHVHRIPHPTFVTIAKRPSCFRGGTGRTDARDLPDGTSGNFFASGVFRH
jgi:hypothetical protein